VRWMILVATALTFLNSSITSGMNENNGGTRRDGFPNPVAIDILLAKDAPDPKGASLSGNATRFEDAQAFAAEALPEEAWFPAPITFYACEGAHGGFCGRMASGRIVYEGAAACGRSYKLGTRLGILGDPTGRVYTCEDRGLLAPTQVDVFWYKEADGWLWLAQVGTWAQVRRR
jgi:hypothetical protein